MDVRSLYTSVPNNKNIAETKKRYENYTYNKLYTLKLSQTFLALFFKLNNYVFNSKFKLQIKGCTMGTICSPKFVNIFIATNYSLLKTKWQSKPP